MRLTRSILIVAVASCVFRSEVARADPAGAIGELRSTPISAFDLGMYSLKQALHEQFREQGIEVDMPNRQLRQYETGAGYNPNTGVLTVYAIGFDYPPVPEKWNFASECQQVLSRMRIHLGYDASADKLYKEPSFLMDHFLENYRGELSGDIAEATTITLIRGIKGQRYECSGSLMSRDLQISD